MVTKDITVTVKGNNADEVKAIEGFVDVLLNKYSNYTKLANASEKVIKDKKLIAVAINILQ